MLFIILKSENDNNNNNNNNNNNSNNVFSFLFNLKYIWVYSEEVNKKNLYTILYMKIIVRHITF